MQAVFVSGGKQYRVRVGSIVAVEKITAEAGAQVDFEQVLLIAADGDAAADGNTAADSGATADSGVTAVGAPLIAGAKVRATVVAQERGPKLRIFKLRRRKNSRRSGGHRQSLTRIKVDEIIVPAAGLAAASSADSSASSGAQAAAHSEESNNGA